MTARRILLVGWSAADWRLLDPLLESGSLPNLARLLARGARGNIRTLQPQFVPLLWASIDTGRLADAHGVLAPLVPNDDNTASPLSRLDRRCPALWNISGQAGLESIVVNWPATFPAERMTGACVSELFFRLAGDADGLEPVPDGATWPLELAESLRDLRFSPAELAADEVSFFVPGIQAEDSNDDPLAARVAVALAETITTHAVVTEMLQRDSWQLAMVRYEFLESLGPEIWACHPPRLPYVPGEVFERFRGTLNAACRYLDLLLGVLLDMTGDDTLVVLVSEHGMQCGPLRPQEPHVAFRQGGGAPWYREQGVVAMAGPGVAAGREIRGANLLDVAPTVLNWLDVPLAPDLPGRVLEEAFDEIPDMQRSARTKVGDGASPGSPMRSLSEAQRQAAIRRLQETGLIGAQDALGPEAASNARRERDFNLAMVALDAGRPRRAISVLEHLHERHPDDDRIALHLARTLRSLGDLEQSRTLLEQVVDHPDQRPLEQMELAELYLAEGKHDAALMCLFKAEQAVGQRPQVHSRIGQVYLRLQRWDEAERAFGKALERDEEHAQAYRGLAALELGRKRYADATAAALRAIDLDRNRAQGHYLLGEALLRDGQAAIAAQVFETCLGLEPNHHGANRSLSEALHMLGEDQLAKEHAERARRLETAALLRRELRNTRK